MDPFFCAFTAPQIVLLFFFFFFSLFLTILKKERFVLPGRTKGVIGTLSCECHLVLYYRSNGGELVSLNLFIAQNYTQHKFLKKNILDVHGSCESSSRKRSFSYLSTPQPQYWKQR